MALISTYETIIWMMALVYLFGPGWLWTFWFFPDEHPSWQIVVGSGIGIPLLGLIALSLSLLPWGITQDSVLLVSMALNGLCLIPLCIAPERAIQRLSQLFSSLGLDRKSGWKDYLTPVLTLLSLVAFLIVAPFLSRGDKESYTEFYIVDGLYKAPPWRRTIDADTPVSLTFAVVSREKAAESFQVHVVTEEETIQVIPLQALEPGESVELGIHIPPRANSEQSYTLVLYKGDLSIPYRTLHFWLRTPPESILRSAERESMAR